MNIDHHLSPDDDDDDEGFVVPRGALVVRASVYLTTMHNNTGNPRNNLNSSRSSYQISHAYSHGQQ